jgi:hypothetical protein
MLLCKKKKKKERKKERKGKLKFWKFGQVKP